MKPLYQGPQRKGHGHDATGAPMKPLQLYSQHIHVIVFLSPHAVF